MEPDETSDNSFVSTFIDMMKAAMPDKVIANFIFVAEVVGNQDNELSIVTSNGMTPWLAQGMLQSAEDMIINGSMSFLDDEED